MEVTLKCVCAVTLPSLLVAIVMRRNGKASLGAFVYVAAGLMAVGASLCAFSLVFHDEWEPIAGVGIGFLASA